MKKLDLKYLYSVAKEFFNVDNIVDIQAINGGHINSTYMIVFPDCRYVLQQINHYVFHSPLGVMNNMILLTNHIAKKCNYEGKSRTRSGLNLVPTRYGQYVAIVDGNYWRCTEFIEGGICYDILANEHIFKEVGRAVGNFHYMLDDFHSRLIDDPIPDFHNTPLRIESFIEKINELKETNPVLLEEVQDEIDYILSNKNKLDIIAKGLETTVLRRRACHNDTKLSNVMIDEKTGKYMCLIDLDTAMKGAIAYDYGDAIRGGASNALEDETDLSKVSINLSLVRAFTRGFLYELSKRKIVETREQKIIDPEEVATLYQGIYIITVELGIRFLYDYLDGNKYFRIDENRPKHNLERAKNQLTLAKDIASKKKDIIKIINEALKDYGYQDFYFLKEE